MRIADAFNLKIRDCFGKDDNDDVPSFDFSQLGGDSTAWGVSKFVIFPSGNLNKVIKIPFEGVWEYNSEIEDEEWFEFEVIKDYCAEEAAIYDEAVEAGLECFFAKTEFGGFTKDGTKFYIADRVKPFDWHRATEGSEKKANEIRCSLDSIWIANAIDCYGLDKVNELVAFLWDRNLHDFHDGNVGMREDGSPVLLDYSDYKEEW